MHVRAVPVISLRLICTFVRLTVHHCYIVSAYDTPRSVGVVCYSRLAFNGCGLFTFYHYDFNYNHFL